MYKKTAESYIDKKYTNSGSAKTVQPLKITECKGKEYWRSVESCNSKLAWQEKYHERELTTGKPTSDGSTRYLCLGVDKKQKFYGNMCERKRISRLST